MKKAIFTSLFLLVSFLLIKEIEKTSLAEAKRAKKYV